MCPYLYPQVLQALPVQLLVPMLAPCSYPCPQVLQALWDGSEGCELMGERQRLVRLFELWSGLAGAVTVERITTFGM